jgi:hypothetical protein
VKRGRCQIEFGSPKFCLIGEFRESFEFKLRSKQGYRCSWRRITAVFDKKRSKSNKNLGQRFLANLQIVERIPNIRIAFVMIKLIQIAM